MYGEEIDYESDTRFLLIQSAKILAFEEKLTTLETKIHYNEGDSTNIDRVSI